MDPPKREGILNYLSGFFKVLVTTDSKSKKKPPTPASTSTLLSCSSPRRKISLRPSTSAAAVLPQYDNSGTASQKRPKKICNRCTESHSRPLSMDSSSSSIPSFIEITCKDSVIEMDSNLLSCSTLQDLSHTETQSPSYNDNHYETDNRQRSSRPRTRVTSRLPVRSPSDREFDDSPSLPVHNTDAAKGSTGDHCHLSPKRSLKQTHHCPAAYGERREFDHREKSYSPRKTSIPRPIVRDRDTYDNPIPSTSKGKTEIIYMRRRPRSPVNDSSTFLEHTSVDKSAPHRFTSTGTQVSKVFIQEKSTTTSKLDWKQPSVPRLPQIPVRRTRAWETPERRPRVWEEPRPIAGQVFERQPTVKQEDERQPIVQMEGEEILKLPLNFDEPCLPRRSLPEEPANAPLRVVSRGEDTLKLPLDFDRPCTPRMEPPTNPPSRKSSDLKKKLSSTGSVGTPTPEKKPSTSSEVSTPPPETVEKKSSIIKVYTRDDLVLRFHSNFTAVDTYPVIRPCPFRVLRTSPSFGLDNDIENQPSPPGTSRGSVFSTPSALAFSKLKQAVAGIQPELCIQKPKPQQPEEHPQSRHACRSGHEDTPQVYPSTSRAAMPVVYPSISRNELELPSTSRSSIHSIIQSSSKASDHSIIKSSSKASIHSVIQSSSTTPVLPLVPEGSEPIPSTSMEEFLKPSTSKTPTASTSKTPTPSTSKTPTASTSKASTPRTRPNTPKAYSMSELPSASKPSGLRHCFPTKATCMEIPTYSDTTESEMLSVSRRNSRVSVAASDSSAKSNFRLRRTNTVLSLDHSISSNLTTIDEEKISIYSAMSTSRPDLSPLEAALARYDELDSAATLAKAMRKKQLLNNEFPLDDTELQLLEECATVEDAGEDDPRPVEAPNWQSNDFYEDTDTEVTTDEDSQKKKDEGKKRKC